MRLDHRERDTNWITAHRHDQWPHGCDTDADGALTLHGARLDGLAAAWGTPLWVVDEPAFMQAVDELVQLRGARPLFGAGPLAPQTTRWAQARGWDVWGDHATLAHGRLLTGVPPRWILDLRGQPRAEEIAATPARLVVNARNLDLELLERAAPDSVYLNIDGISQGELGRVLARLAARSGTPPPLAGLALRIDSETPLTARARVGAALATVSDVVATTRRLVVDGGVHPDPLPVLRALLGRTGGPDGGAVVLSVLADLSAWLLRRASLALVRVDSVHGQADRQVIGLSGGAPTAIAASVRAVLPTGGAPRETLLVWPSGRTLVTEAPELLAPGDVLAVPGVSSSPGLCVVLGVGGLAVPATGSLSARAES
jgi:hypothetical protein